MIYINPSRHFDDEHTRYAPIQIDNSLKYWKPEEILLVTNFPYKYHDIKACEVPDNLFFKFWRTSSKINAIVYLLENKILTESAWMHDFDAFQVNPFKLRLKQDLGLTDYGWKPKINTGSFFFKPTALDIFKWIKKDMYKRQAAEEDILWILYKENFRNIRARCQKLNITYNLGKRNVEFNLQIADKPIRVFHFHPYRESLFQKFKPHLPDSLAKLIYEKSPNLS